MDNVPGQKKKDFKDNFRYLDILKFHIKYV